ncbi:hypothetical protein ACFWJ4_29550 [Kitasatospora sp. NPDC127067]|uniref:hypothetical protein n=1 Tax=Kitasatospora sp. NPDC127067 TaxID=3347126 RepID=UPI0036610842
MPVIDPSGKALVAYLADGTPAPTALAGRTLTDVVEWALETKLGSPRLHRPGKDGDALVVLTEAAPAQLGLPPLGRDEKKEFVQRLGQLPKTHEAVKTDREGRLAAHPARPGPLGPHLSHPRGRQVPVRPAVHPRLGSPCLGRLADPRRPRHPGPGPPARYHRARNLDVELNDIVWMDTEP